MFPGGTATTASSYTPGHEPSRATDDDPNTEWIPARDPRLRWNGPTRGYPRQGYLDVPMIGNPGFDKIQIKTSRSPVINYWIEGTDTNKENAFTEHFNTGNGQSGDMFQFNDWGEHILQMTRPVESENIRIYYRIRGTLGPNEYPGIFDVHFLRDAPQ